MPTYPYKCSECGTYDEVVKPMKKAGSPEKCSYCYGNLVRLWVKPQAIVSRLGYYDYGLGRYIGHKSHKKDAIRKANDETGAELVEVGNELKAIKKIKPKRQKYKIPRERRDNVKLVT